MIRQTRQKVRTAWLMAATTCALLGLSQTVDAVGTRQFVFDDLKSFDGGDLTGVSVASDGTVRAGWTLGAASVPDASSVWSSVVLPDGSVLLGTGSGGTIYRVAKGKVTVAAKVDALAVSSLALAWDGDVIAGSFPGGKVYRIPVAKLDGSEVKDGFTDLKQTEDIWGLAYDDKTKALYAATGPEGLLYRVDAKGAANVYFDSDEPHLVSVAIGHDGAVYAGSNGKALLYKVDAPGRASVVFDFDHTDVKALAIAPADKGGALYAIANSYKGSFKGLRPKRPESNSPAKPNPASTPKPGNGVLMRFDNRGVVEQMLENKSTHFVSLALDGDGRAYVGTGDEGRVYSVDDNHTHRLVVDTDERQVGTMVLHGPTRFIATSDPVVFHEITGTGGADAVWTSEVQDAGLRAHFGQLQWRAEGQLELQTRSGNTEKPDTSWSAWSAAMARPGKIISPAARFLQVRARFNRDAAAVLSEVKVSFVTDNARGLLTEVTAGGGSSSSSSGSIPESGGPLDDPSSKVKIDWKVDNPDNDTLRYRLFYRAVGGTQWFSLLQPDEKLTKTSYTWETTGVPEGEYRVRIDATDELSNPPDRITRHSLESRTITVDNTPPVLDKLVLRGGRLQGTAVDGLGPIARLELALVGSDAWMPMFPVDDVFDQATESFDTDISTLLPPGPQLVVVRAYDSAGNRVTRTVSAVTR